MVFFIAKGSFLLGESSVGVKYDCDKACDPKIRARSRSMPPGTNSGARLFDVF
jgi:hypothetical protein